MTTKTLTVSPFYHEAKNELARPDRAVFCSQYFVEKWMPRLGATATCIVLCMRRLGGNVVNGEAAIQVNQDDIATAIGCSDRTIRREISDNAALSRFVRVEDRFMRGEHGHVRRVESVYYIAMDDPLVDEDEPLLRTLLERKEQRPTSGGKVIEPVGVIGQFDRIRGDVIGQFDRIRDEKEILGILTTVEDNLSEQSLLETNDSRNVSETRLSGQTGTNNDLQSLQAKAKVMANRHTQTPVSSNTSAHFAKEHDAPIATPTMARSQGTKPMQTSSATATSAVETWRRETENLAHCSAQELDDMRSFGFHICVWNHARKADRQHGGAQVLTEGVFAILRSLSQRRKETGSPQGKAWTRRTRKWFDDNGCPLLVKADETELAQVRAALKDAPFLQDPQ